MFKIKGKPVQVQMVHVVIACVCIVVFALSAKWGYTMMRDYLVGQDQKAAKAQPAPQR